MIRIDPEKCEYKSKNCGICVDMCPRGALAKENEIVVDINKCNNCYLCVTACIYGAITYR